MYFNSLEFAVFLPIVFVLYWFVFKNKLKLQNLLLLVASYVFYSFWDWRFLSLIILSTVVDFYIGKTLTKTTDTNKRKALLYSSIFLNIGLLGFFKYYNFFIDSFTSAFSFFGQPITIHSLHIILPVGISFYTFQTLSYTIDVYRKKIEPTHNFINFATFVSFFPQLVAGPIERASHLLPQFSKTKQFIFEKGRDGMRQILWGLFKKVVIADQCAKYVDIIFANPESYSGSTLLLGAVLFAFQIYGDFSGYSDIAIGTARLFGFNLKQNFAFPYFSKNIKEFWSRWHISLTTWFRDYLYIPLGGNRKSKLFTLRNIFLVFLISGFWHGANWTFIFWGLLHALLFVPYYFWDKKTDLKTAITSNKITNLLKIVFTFLLVTLAWIFFRADTINNAFTYLLGLFNSSLFSFPELLPKYLFLILSFFIIVEWLGKNKLYAIETLSYKWYVRYPLYYGLAFLILLYSGNPQRFIYFQF
ncbi:MBOAT family O-acyltransferase [Lacinutrix salivirga]